MDGTRRLAWAAALWIVGSTVVLALGTEVEAGWRRPHGDAQGRNRVPVSGQLRGDLDHHPGFAHVLELDAPTLPDGQLRDVNGDGVPELLLPYRGRVAALDLSTGQFAWQSPVAAIDRLVEFADFDGDGELELLAASRRVGGGLVSVSPSTGAILAKSPALPHRSGVAAEELAIADLDQDGDDDVVFPAGLFGLGQFWVGGLGPGQEQWSLAVEHSGYANLTPARVGRFSAGGGPGILLDQGANQQLFEACAPPDPPSDPDAACGGALCLCPSAGFAGVHSGAYAFGEVFVIDLEGDGVDEVLTLADDPRYTRSVSAFSPALAVSEGSGAAGQLWYRDYSAGPATTLIAAPSLAPVDLDQDGGVELLVSFVDNLGSDRDLGGAAISDGVDHPGLSAAVFDGRTGAVEATLLDVFAHGWVDLDDDGRPEIVVSPVPSNGGGSGGGVSWDAGLTGYELGCAGGCLSPAWSTPHAFAPPAVRETYERERLPIPHLDVVQVDGRDALLAYDDGRLELLGVNPGDPIEVLASRPLSPAQVVVEVVEGFVLLADARELLLLDAELEAVGPAVPIPVQGVAPWMSARYDGFDAPVFEAKLYPAPIEADGPLGEPLALLPHMALAEDFDGQPGDEIVDFRRPEDGLGPGFEVRLLDWTEQGQLTPLWTLLGDTEPALAGLELQGAMHFGTGDFDGQGRQDLVFAVRDSARNSYLVTASGDDGQVLGVTPVTSPASFAPLLVADLGGPGGPFDLDGRDDVLVDGAQELALLVSDPQGALVGPLLSKPASFYHAVGAQADVDGDGRRELVATTSSTLDNPGGVLDLDAGLALSWGPIQLGLPTGRTQVLAFANVDGDAGLDLLYLTGEGSVELRGGQTGASLPGAPVVLAGGEIVATPPAGSASLAAVIVLDVDHDGHDEAVVGADDGWVYALNLAHEGGAGGASGAPSIEWALEVGAPVSQLAGGDVDRDGFAELLVATEAGQGIILDSLGAFLEITSPDGSCEEVGSVEVLGVAHGLATVDLLLNGVLAQTVAVDPDSDADSEWAASVVLPGPGEYELRAEGRDNQGDLVALSTRSVTYGGDEDGDGVSACAGDCNDLDPGVSPDTVEICGDGLDQDCDGEDLVCDAPEEPEDDDGGSFPGTQDWNPRGRCNCDAIGAGDAGRELGLVGLGLLLLIGVRRRDATASL